MVDPADFDDEDWEDEAAEEGELPDLGSCCACGRVQGSYLLAQGNLLIEEVVIIRNVLMLPYRTPTPGQGWGCFVCGLPAEGAVAVICHDCLQNDKDVLWVCAGYPGDNVRVLLSELSQTPFDHNTSKHPEVWP